MSFYFYEPNHIGKRAYPKDSRHKYSNELAMRQHISNMEVSLNHLFSILLSISPNRLTRLITQKSLGLAVQDKYFLDQVDVTRINKIMGDATQPDVVMTGQKSRVMIEMKTGTKTSLNQYYKYLLFTYFMDKETKPQTSYLIYLAKDSLERTWREKFTSQEAIKHAFESYDIPIKSKKGNIDTGLLANKLRDVSGEMSIGFLTYQDLFNILENEISENVDNEILVNLYSGFNQELTKRLLAK